MYVSIGWEWFNRLNQTKDNVYHETFNKARTKECPWLNSDAEPRRLKGIQSAASKIQEILYKRSRKWNLRNTHLSKHLRYILLYQESGSQHIGFRTRFRLVTAYIWFTVFQYFMEKGSSLSYYISKCIAMNADENNLFSIDSNRENERYI